MDFNKILLILFVVFGTAMSSSDDEQDTHLEHGDAKLLKDQKQYGKDGKVLNVFTVVTFPNDSCIGDGSRNGTCYTEAECDDKGGQSQGTCAQGFGICCVFVGYCGSTTAENCTYFESTGTADAGKCGIEVCPCRSGICQMRLDFTTFVITGPSTTTVTEVFLEEGKISGGAGTANTLASVCLTDTFTVTGSNTGMNQPPTICGTNTGEHMYAEMDNNNCNSVDFQLGSTGIAATLATRSWSIKITQISCTSDIRAPYGCTQYFYGGNTNTVQTYNYNSGAGEHLGNQNQNICVRQERGYCQLCWAATDNLTFDISGKTDAMTGGVGSVCCYYGSQANAATLGYDCLFIPGAKSGVASAELANSIGANRFCGHEEGLVAIASIAAAIPVPATGAEGTICTKHQPFSITFLSDGFEAAIANGESIADGDGSGFQLGYFLNNNGC